MKQSGSSKIPFCGIAVLCLAAYGIVTAQEADTSLIKRLRQDMDSIASDVTEGRMTGSPGFMRAARYAAGVFRKSGLHPGIENESYFQPVPFIRNNYGSSGITLRRNGTDQYYMHSPDNFVVLNSGMPSKHTAIDSAAFLGYGISEPESGWDDYKGIDVEGKWVILLNGIPPADGNYAFPESLRKQYGDRKTHDSLILNALGKHKAAGLIVLPDKQAIENWESVALHNYRYDDIRYADPEANRMEQSDPAIPVILLHPKLAHLLFSGQSYDPINTKGGYRSYILNDVKIGVTLECKKESVNCCNVIAVVPGSDPVLGKEYITVGAHLDHLGKIGDHVYNGANDDASGCVIILEAAREIAFHPPKRSVVFVLYTSEEQNLIGSRHFLKNPPVPPGRITLNINIEQIGSRHRDFPGIWAIGSPEFEKPFRTASSNSIPGMEVKYDLIDKFKEGLQGNVDLWSYCERGIPAVVLSSGGFPEHHTIQDTIDLIDFDHLQKAVKLLSSFIAELANNQ